MTDTPNKSATPEPCPFCGHVGLDFADGSTYRWGIATCSGCGASTGEVRRDYPDTGAWHADAIAEWNTRAPSAQVEADRRDAARYRWLRQQPNDTRAPRIDVVLWTEADESANEGTGLRLEALDEAIDAAMKGAPHD